MGVFSKLTSSIRANPSLWEETFDMSCSFKIDGVRLSYQHGRIWTKSGKNPLNAAVKELLIDSLNQFDGCEGIEGELVVSEDYRNGSITDTNSLLFSNRHQDIWFYFNVFDIKPIYKNETFIRRQKRIKQILQPTNKTVMYSETKNPLIRLVRQYQVTNIDEVVTMFNYVERFGIEGIVLRKNDESYDSPIYKLRVGYDDEERIRCRPVYKNRQYVGTVSLK